MPNLTRILEEIDVLKEVKEPKVLFRLVNGYIGTAENLWEIDNKKAVEAIKKAVIQISMLLK
jgi:hypothetical protein